MARIQSSDPPLPFDILIMIKMLIPITDLRTHVCFYNTCRTIALLYGTPDEEEAFWEKSCRLCGIHLMDCDDPDQLETCRTWREVAFHCIAKDGFCNHPFCGDALLRYNAIQIADTVKRIPQWDPETACDSQVIGTKQPFVHPIFMFIGYSPFGAPETEDIRMDAYLRYIKEEGKHPTRTALCEHPIARRSTSLFPAVFEAHYYDLRHSCWDPIPRGRDAVKGKGAVTVWNVHRFVRSELDNPFRISGLLGQLNHDWSFLLEQREIQDFVASHQTSLKRRGRSVDSKALCSLREFVHLFEPSISFVLHRVYNRTPPPWRYFALFVTRKSKEMEQIYYNPRKQASPAEKERKSLWKRVTTLPVFRHYLPKTKALAEPQIYSTEDISRVINSFYSH